MAYIAPSDIENFLGIDLQTTGLDQVNALIPGVEAFFERSCNRKWNQSGNITEVFDGGTNLFVVAAPPIASVVSLTDDGTTLTANADYYVYRSYIKTTFRTTYRPRCVTIVYTSAALLPLDIKHAMVRWVAQIYKEAKDAGKPVSRVSMGPMAVEFVAQEIPQFVREVIAAHRLRPL